MPLYPPTEYYCKELAPLDEEICSLLAKRKEMSDENPGFPNSDLIAKWSQKFGLNEDWLRRMFAVYLQAEECYQPPVEPTGFLKFIPVLKSVMIEDFSHTVTYMKQYSNASIVYVETELIASGRFVRFGHAGFELLIAPEYQCRQEGGSGSGKILQHSFVVTPPLPDDICDVEFQLRVKPFPKDTEFQEVEFKEVIVTIK